MKHTEIKVPVIVIEESDLEGISDEGRITGTMEEARVRLQAQFDRNQTVSVGLRPDPRKGDVPWIAVGPGAQKVKLFAGDAIAFFPSGPQKVEAPEEKPKPAKKAVKKAAPKSEDVDQDDE